MSDIPDEAVMPTVHGPWCIVTRQELRHAHDRIRELEEQKATLIRALESEQNSARGAQLNAGVRAEGLSELLERMRDA